jgi:DNA-binding transcriptional LysR family regulator
MRLDLSLIEIFCIVYEEGSFSRAASKLQLSQPTVSGHIKNLEDSVGARLFDRLPRQAVPTQPGKILYRRGRAILDQKYAAVQELNKFLNRVEGSLTISASTIPGEYLLPQIIASFRMKYPGVNVELQISDSEDVCQRALSGKAEIGFVGAKFELTGLGFRHFASDTLALIVPDNEEWSNIKSLTLEELSQKPFLTRESGSGTRTTFEKVIGPALDNFNVVASFGSTNAIKEALKAGLGVSVLSLIAVSSEIARGEFKTVEIKDVRPLHREFFMVVNTNLTASPIADAFVECVHESGGRKAFQPD